MIACLLWIGLLSGVCLAETGQAGAEGPDAPRALPGDVGASADRPAESEVLAEHLAVFDRPDERSYELGTLAPGDRVRVREWAAGGWAAIDPPASAIGWIERGALELGDEDDERGAHRLAPASPGSGPSSRAWVVAPKAVVRSGRLEARMPGPPWLELPKGTMVRLVDRPPATIGRGSAATPWLAIVPPAEASCHVRADGLRPPPRREGVSEVLAAYMVPDGDDPKADGPLPPGVSAEIARVDAAHRAILTGQAIDGWRFDQVRADYQAILKRSGDNPAVEEALRARLVRVTRHEQAAAAAREFQEVLTRSRRRDEQVAWMERRLAAVDRYRTVSYLGVGFVQPSSRLLNGRKLHVLIDQNGQTIAFLDLPPGLDVESLQMRRVGVRGAVHYNQELGTRLITVRDLEPVAPRR